LVAALTNGICGNVKKKLFGARSVRPVEKIYMGVNFIHF